MRHPRIPVMPSLLALGFVEAFATNEGFRTVSSDEYNDCLERGGDPDDRRVPANETCT